MTHASVPKDQRDVLGIGDNFVRISIGLESAEDLIEDLNQAFNLRKLLIHTTCWRTNKTTVNMNISSISPIARKHRPT